MTIMLAGGMGFAMPGMVPNAYAAGELSVSAQEVGNFAGIQVIEIVVNDDARSDTSESQGIPNVEINGDDVLMAQLDDGSWYAYVANQLAIDTYEADSGKSITGIYGGSALGASYYDGSDSEETYGQIPYFLDGYKSLSAISGTTDVSASATTSVVFAGAQFNVEAFGTITATGEITIGDSITIGTTTFVASSGGGGANEFDIDATGTGLDIDELLIAIQADATTVALVDSTNPTDTTILITAVDGTTAAAGNAIVFDDNAGTVTADNTSAFLEGGLDADTVTINSIVYTGVTGTAVAASAEFNADNDDDAATTLVVAITELDAEITAVVGSSSDTVDLTVNTGGALGNTIPITSSEDTRIDTTAFSGGVNAIGSVDNNPALDTADWPFIQTYDISGNSDVTITYGTGSTAETIEILYDYDDDRDISLDRQRYPDNSFVFIELDDSLLNLSPIAEEFWTFSQDGTVNFAIGSPTLISVGDIDYEAVGFEEGPFKFSTASGVYVLSDTDIHDTIKETTDVVVLFRESNDNDNIFVNYDRSDESNLIVVDNGEASVSYNSAYSIIQDSFNGVIKFITTVDEWYAGVELELQLVDEDRNLNTRSDETIEILVDEVPYISIGEPLTIDVAQINNTDTSAVISVNVNTLTDSKTGEITLPDGTDSVSVTFEWPTDYVTSIDNFYIFPYLNYDFSVFGGPSGTQYVGNTSGLDEDSNPQSDSDVTIISNSTYAGFTFDVDTVSGDTDGQVYIDLFFFGQEGDISDGTVATEDFTGDIEDNVNRVNDAIYRFELEETDDNTATYEGTVEYIMINQLNVFNEGTYDSIDTTGDEIIIIVNDDLDGSDAVRVSYNDFDSTENDETISAQEDANTHSGKISLDKEGYTAGNTITVTLDDSDLNTDSDTIQTYDAANAKEWLGNDNVWLVKLLIDDTIYDGSCDNDLSLSKTGLTLIETGDETGIFVGTLKLPSLYCTGLDENNDGTIDGDDAVTTNGKDLEFEYQDYSDASGEPNETSTSVSVRSTTGSVKLDNTVYGVPIHKDSFKLYSVDSQGDPEYLVATPTKLVIRVDDPDFNVSASGEDTLDASAITVEVSRSGNKVDLSEFITFESTLVEIAPDAGIFELEVEIPQDLYFGDSEDSDTSRYVQQGDIITVTYTDASDASGSENTVTDSATFDLRNGVLQSDKSVYVIGSEAIITLIEPDLNLDSETAETWDLALINWDSDAGEDNLSNDIFDANPSGLRETGDSTGIFQVVIEIPAAFEDGDKLERGEQIELEYTDYGPAGADYIGDDDEEVKLNIFTSNFGATVELDQKVYSWTDKVYVTVVAPDHNFDSNAIDEIGNDSDSAINISTREDELEEYKLVETGTDTGIFTGEFILTGFTHDADGSSSTGDDDGNDVTFVAASGTGPTGGLIPSSDDDGLTVSFEFSDGDTAYGSALIRWNIGEVQWLEASYPASGSGFIRVIDSDMNFKPEAVDSFDIDVWSDTDAGGITLSVTETNEATGIFEGTVFFTTTDASSGSRLAVSEGDTVTAEYEDNTLPDPYNTADELEITATTLIGTLVPPLERAPATELRTVDAFGNTLSSVQIDQQIQVTANIGNGQERDQDFAYLLQVQNEDGVTVSLSWLTGSLGPGQSFSPAVSWIPTEIGTYEATVFVWESVDNPTALSPPISTSITVS